MKILGLVTPLFIVASLFSFNGFGKEKPQMTESIRIATFNVSMEADNLPKVEVSKTKQSDSDKKASVHSSVAKTYALTAALKKGTNKQIQNIAEIIQRVRPDIILLNEFDYIEERQKGIDLFQANYLAVSQQQQQPINYPYQYLAPVNTGVPTQLGSLQDGQQRRLSHFGFGKYPGQYGMVLLSKYPIIEDEIRTFQTFLWKDMPGNLMPKNPDGTSWYHKDEVEVMRLSSKSHWDIPVQVGGEVIHVLASHPTPPVFDGKEDRNGRRNYDELRFWKDYISSGQDSYHYDDEGHKGGLLVNKRADKATPYFVILGDLNASDVEGDAYPGAASQLLAHPLVNKNAAPTSKGGLENNSKLKKTSQYAETHTASWGMRADYVLPSANMVVEESGVFWPATTEDTSRLVESRRASSDHRLVWVEVSIK